MAKQLLSGPLEEQAAKLYEIAQERMKAGAYTGAVHYLKEIQQAVPNFRDVPELLAQAEAAKRENTFLLCASIFVALGAVLGSRMLGWTNDIVSLVLGVVGLFAGWFIGFLIYTPFRQSKTADLKVRNIKK